MGSCDLCSGDLAASYTVREMMHGTREEFTYGECEHCRSLQLVDVPADLAPYYPENYYSFSLAGQSILRRLAKRLRAEAVVRGRFRVAKAVGRGAALPAWVDWLRVAGLTRSASICDIGCGSGELLLDLKDQGFSDLVGADAFIPNSMVRRGIHIQKATPSEVEGRYDLVMLNHSFEHIPDPLGTLEALAPRLNPGGFIMVRVPVAASPVWEEFGTDCEFIDAPRHLFLPSHAGMAAVVDRAGMTLVDTLHETSPVQFWRSEQYRQDIPLFDARSYEVNPTAAGFTSDQIAVWEEQAAELNASGRSAAAAFFLQVAA
jgi:SAM-dependent methyltransferase